MHDYLKVEIPDVEGHISKSLHKCEMWFHLFLSNIDKGYWPKVVWLACCELCLELCDKGVEVVNWFVGEVSEQTQCKSFQGS